LLIFVSFAAIDLRLCEFTRKIGSGSFSFDTKGLLDLVEIRIKIEKKNVYGNNKLPT